MPEPFVNLFNPTSITIIIVFIIVAILIIVLRGKSIIAKFGNKSIKIGGTEEERALLEPPQTTIMVQKRTCGDCILLLMGEREKFELKMRRETNKVLKTQMTFAEQKIMEIQSRILTNMTEAVHDSIENKDTNVEESVQYKLIYGLIKDALLHIKDEVRRSYKDNGFYEINGSEFSWYVKERTQTITSMLNQYIRNIYPDRGGVLKLHKVLKVIEKESTFLSGIINDIYSYAREVRLECDTKVEDIRAQFGQWVDDFIN